MLSFVYYPFAGHQPHLVMLSLGFLPMFDLLALCLLLLLYLSFNQQLCAAVRVWLGGLPAQSGTKLGKRNFSSSLSVCHHCAAVGGNRCHLSREKSENNLSDSRMQRCDFISKNQGNAGIIVRGSESSLSRAVKSPRLHVPEAQPGVEWGSQGKVRWGRFRRGSGSNRGEYL